MRMDRPGSGSAEATTTMLIAYYRFKIIIWRKTAVNELKAVPGCPITWSTLACSKSWGNSQSNGASLGTAEDSGDTRLKSYR